MNAVLDFISIACCIVVTVYAWVVYYRKEYARAAALFALATLLYVQGTH